MSESVDLRRRRDIAAANYRHEWDYGTEESAEQALSLLVERQRAVLAHDILDEVYTSKGKTIPEGAREDCGRRLNYYEIKASVRLPGRAP